MENIKDILLQSKNEKFVVAVLGTEQWIQVCGHKNLNGADAGFWCGLVDIDHIDEIFHNISWDISADSQSCPGFISGLGGYQYKRNILNTGFESILYYREFYGVKPDYVELSQEFILLNNLRYDSISNSYWAMYDSGESEEAVRFNDKTTVSIKTKFLRNYSAAKQMAIVLYFDMRTEFTGKMLDYGIEEINTEIRNENLFYSLWGGDNYLPEYTYSVLMGKKIILPPPVEECGYWPYEKKEIYEDFIIGVDESGKEIIFTCNPNKLANYFGANPEAPMYLTPVFFKKEVLQKYISKPELYEIRDGRLSCKSLWSLAIDNHHKNCVSVYLGDLGRDLPESERSYWKHFNIIGEEKLSKISFLRDFANIPVPSNMADHQFQYLYEMVSKQWDEKFGWQLFLPLSTEDQYHFSHIRLPISDSQQEFDQLVLSLVKILIDSLNEKELKIADGSKENQKGISKLENWIKSNGVVDFEKHIQFLRELQELRSTGVSHRKGKSYAKISKIIGLEEKEKIDVFEEILIKSNSFLTYLNENFLQ